MITSSGIVMTKNLITILEGQILPEINVHFLIDKAHKNKVLLHALRALNLQGPLREKQESAIKNATKVVQDLSKHLKEYDHAFFKLVKPIAYVPADVDILIRTDQVGEVAKKIMKLGYRIAVKDPYCITLKKADSIIDLYVYPSLGGVIILNGQKLLEYTTTKSFNGIEIRTLEDYAEALVAAAHSIYKERIYTLNDYFIVEKWASPKTHKLAQELECKNSLEAALILNRKIHQGSIEAPYKIPIPEWLMMLLLQKFQADVLTRATSINMLKTLANRHGINQLTSKLTRETY